MMVLISAALCWILSENDGRRGSIPPVAQLIGMEMGYGPKATSSMGENGWTRDV